MASGSAGRPIDRGDTSVAIRLALGNLDNKSLDNQATPLIVAASEAIFRPVATFMMATVGVAATTEAYTSGTADAWGVDDVALIDAHACDLRLAIRPSHIVREMARNSWPTSIEFKCSELPPLDGTSELRLGVFGDYVFGLGQAMITTFFEDNRHKIEATYGALKHWPGAWRFAKVVRDTLSHGGAVHFRHPFEVRWKKLSYTEADNGRRIVNTDIWPGDLIILLREMEAAIPDRTGPSI